MHRLQKRGAVEALTSEPTARERRRRICLVILVAIAALAADQVTKSIAVARLQTHEVHIAGPIAFRLQYNSGIAFSIGTGLTGPIIVVAIVLVLVVAWFARRVPTTGAAVGAGLILGGAVGNLSDRLFRGHHGAVVDFIYTKYWPTFNLADASIVCGCIIVAWTLIASGRSRRGETGVPPG